MFTDAEKQTGSSRNASAGTETGPKKKRQAQRSRKHVQRSIYMFKEAGAGPKKQTHVEQSRSRSKEAETIPKMQKRIQTKKEQAKSETGLKTLRTN